MAEFAEYFSMLGKKLPDRYSILEQNELSVRFRKCFKALIFFWCSRWGLLIFFKKIASSVLSEWSFSISLQTSRFIALPFIDICRYYVFYILTVCGNLASSKTIGTIFPVAFAHLWSLSHILLIPTIFQTFSLLSYLLRWSVILDVTTAKRLQLPKGLKNG